MSKFGCVMNEVSSNELTTPDQSVDSFVGPILMGEEAVFDRMFVRFFAPLSQFAMKYLPQSADAEDIVENIFIRLWCKEERFQNFNHARAALYQATHHACLNHIRGRQRAIWREENYISNTGELDNSLVSNLLQAELIAILNREIDQLPEKYASVLKLSFQEDLKNVEIAQKLNLSIQTVKNYKSQGLNLLKQRIPQDAFLLLAALCINA